MLLIATVLQFHSILISFTIKENLKSNLKSKV